MEYSTTNAIKGYYTTELGSSSSGTTYNAKIGLMYVSDYGYAVSPANWTRKLLYYDNNINRNNNWMYMGLSEWTISRGLNSTDRDRAFRVNDSGSVDSFYVYFKYTSHGIYGIRPTFCLKSNVAITSGDGSSSNPYRVALG